ncbi:MAG: hypothetical protein Q7K28_02595 [Candidatus Wildermuthbacteria bacterium]|nr:hypothetical protein [Candidatus Wildermuthbacteria bacterium]
MKNLNSKTYFLIIVLLFIGFLFFFSTPKEKKEEIKQETPAEIFSLAGVVSEVNEKDDYLLVNNVKVLLDKDTEIIQLKFPFDLKNPPKGGSFTPEKIPIKIGGLKIGDNVLIEAKINIAGKTEFGEVSRIQVLP